MMSFEEIFLGFLIALAAGALIGIERQQDKATQLSPAIGGVRTFTFVTLVKWWRRFAAGGHFPYFVVCFVG